MASLLLFRHGPTEERDPRRWPDDRLRPLSRQGRPETKLAARGLARVEPDVDVVLSSPAVRARATAEIVREELGVGRPVIEWEELAPDEPAAGVLARHAREVKATHLAVLVGHEPTLGELVGLATSGDAVSSVRLSRAGSARVDFPRSVQPGGGQLAWLLTRKQLTELAR
jgi:phosphohistidine phosphatase